MPIGKLNEEDRQRLSNHFFEIVNRVCVANDCWPGEVLNRLKKSRGIKGISPARAEIARKMQATAFTCYAGEGQCRLWLTGDKELPDAHWEASKSISFPLLARMIGCDHSTLVLGQQKLKERGD